MVHQPSFFFNNLVLKHNVSHILQPGLWHAVERDDLTSVRRLVNLWCTTEICHVSKMRLDVRIQNYPPSVHLLPFQTFTFVPLVNQMSVKKHMVSFLHVLERKEFEGTYF